MSDEDDPIDLSMDDDEPSSSSAKPSRQPSAEARGACHSRTFFAKLRPDAIELLDDQINQWLDENPGYEVKFVSTSTGEMMGKQREPTLFVSVWV